MSLVPFGAILTLPPPPWDFATAISAEEGPALPTSSVVSHSRCTYESTCKRSDENPTNSSRALPISLRNSIGVSPPNMFYCCAGETQATAQSQAFTPARALRTRDNSSVPPRTAGRRDDETRGEDLRRPSLDEFTTTTTEKTITILGVLLNPVKCVSTEAATVTTRWRTERSRRGGD